MVDQFTKWVEASPLPDQTAETVARADIDYLFSRLGCPREICTDQGANFNSQLFTQLCEILEITKKGRLRIIRVRMDKWNESIEHFCR